MKASTRSQFHHGPALYKYPGPHRAENPALLGQVCMVLVGGGSTDGAQMPSASHLLAVFASPPHFSAGTGHCRHLVALQQIKQCHKEGPEGTGTAALHSPQPASYSPARLARSVYCSPGTPGAATRLEEARVREFWLVCPWHGLEQHRRSKWVLWAQIALVQLIG